MTWYCHQYTRRLVTVEHLAKSVHVYYMELGEPVRKQKSAQHLRFGSFGCSIWTSYTSIESSSKSFQTRYNLSTLNNQNYQYLNSYMYYYFYFHSEVYQSLEWVSWAKRANPSLCRPTIHAYFWSGIVLKHPACCHCSSVAMPPWSSVCS